MTERQKKMLYQRAMGLLCLAICGFVVWFSTTSPLPQDQDASPILLLGPLGFHLLFTKRCEIY